MSDAVRGAVCRSGAALPNGPQRAAAARLIVFAQASLFSRVRQKSHVHVTPPDAQRSASGVCAGASAASIVSFTVKPGSGPTFVGFLPHISDVSVLAHWAVHS